MLVVAEVAHKCSSHVLSGPLFKDFLGRLRLIILALSALENFGVLINQAYLKVLVCVHQFVSAKVSLSAKSGQPPSDNHSPPNPSSEVHRLIDSLQSELTQPLFVRHQLIYQLNVDESTARRAEWTEKRQDQDQSQWSKEWSAYLERKGRFEAMVRPKWDCGDTGQFQERFIADDQRADRMGTLAFTSTAYNHSVQPRTQDLSRHVGGLVSVEGQENRASDFDCRLGANSLRRVVLAFAVRREVAEEVVNRFVDKLGPESRGLFQRIEFRLRDNWLTESDCIVLTAAKLRLMFWGCGSAVTFYEVLELLAVSCPPQMTHFDFNATLRVKKVIKQLIKAAIEREQLGDKRQLANSIRVQSLAQDPKDCQRVDHQPLFIESYFLRIQQLLHDNRQRDSCWLLNVPSLFHSLTLKQSSPTECADLIINLSVKLSQMGHTKRVLELLAGLDGHLDRRVLRLVYLPMVGVFGQQIHREFSGVDPETAERVCDFFLVVARHVELSEVFPPKALLFSFDSLFVLFQSETKRMAPCHSCPLQSAQPLVDHCLIRAQKRRLCQLSFSAKRAKNKLNAYQFGSNVNPSFGRVGIAKLVLLVKCLVKLARLSFSVCQKTSDCDSIDFSGLFLGVSEMFLFSKQHFPNCFTELFESDMLSVIKEVVQLKSESGLTHQHPSVVRAMRHVFEELSTWTTFTIPKLQKASDRLVTPGQLPLIGFSQHSGGPTGPKPLKLNPHFMKLKCEILCLLLRSGLQWLSPSLSPDFYFSLHFLLMSVESEVQVIDTSPLARIPFCEKRRDLLVFCQSIFKHITTLQPHNHNKLTEVTRLKAELLAKMQSLLTRMSQLYIPETGGQTAVEDCSSREVQRSLITWAMKTKLPSSMDPSQGHLCYPVCDLRLIRRDFIIGLANERMWMSAQFEPMVHQLTASRFCLFAVMGPQAFFTELLLLAEHRNAVSSLVCQTLLCQLFESMTQSHQSLLNQNIRVSMSFGGEFKILFFQAPIGMDWKSLEEEMDRVLLFDHRNNKVVLRDVWRLHVVYHEQFVVNFNSKSPLSILTRVKNRFVLIGSPLAMAVNRYLPSASVYCFATLLVMTFLLFCAVLTTSIVGLIRTSPPRKLIPIVVLKNSLFLLLCMVLFTIDILGKSIVGTPISIALCLMQSVKTDKGIRVLLHMAVVVVSLFVVLLGGLVLIDWNEGIRRQPHDMEQSENHSHSIDFFLVIVSELIGWRMLDMSFEEVRFLPFLVLMVWVVCCMALYAVFMCEFISYRSGVL